MERCVSKPQHIWSRSVGHLRGVLERWPSPVNSSEAGGVLTQVMCGEEAAAIFNITAYRNGIH